MRWCDTIKIDGTIRGDEGGKWTKVVQDRIQCRAFAQALLSRDLLLPVG
jgi:hypothetical protein